MWETGKFVQCIAGENRKWYSLCVVWQFFKKVKNKITTWPSNSTSEYTSKRIESTNSNSYFYTHVFKELFTKVREWKIPMYSLMGEWIDKMWCIHTIYYYLALKRKIILTHGTTQMNFEAIMLNKWLQPVTEGQVLYDSTQQKCLE